MAKACAYWCRQCCFIDGFGEFGELGLLVSQTQGRTVDTEDERHFGTSADMFGQFGTGAEVSYGQ